MSTPYHFYEGHSSLFQNKWKESTTIYHHFAYLFKVFPLFSQPYTYRRCLPPRVPLQPAVDWKIQNRGTKPTKTFKTPFRSACPLIKYPPLPTKRVTCPLARAEAPQSHWSYLSSTNPVTTFQTIINTVQNKGGRTGEGYTDGYCWVVWKMFKNGLRLVAAAVAEEE